jgi:parvulin-like peptidyl-prolyl isomerase
MTIALTMFAVVGTVLVIAAHHLSVTGRFNMNRLEVSVALIPVAVVCGILSLAVQTISTPESAASDIAASNARVAAKLKATTLERVRVEKSHTSKILARYGAGTMSALADKSFNRVQPTPVRNTNYEMIKESMVVISNARLTRAIENEALAYENQSVKLERRSRAVRSLNSARAEFNRLSSKSPTKYESSGKVTTVIANN